MNNSYVITILIHRVPSPPTRRLRPFQPRTSYAIQRTLSLIEASDGSRWFTSISDEVLCELDALIDLSQEQ